MFRSIAMGRTRLSQIPSLDPIGARASIVISMLVDAVFIIIWAVISYLVSSLLNEIEINGLIDKFALKVLQWISTVSVLIPVACYTLIDVWRILVRTFVALTEAWEKRHEYRKI
jgi:hypothetical protein